MAVNPMASFRVDVGDEGGRRCLWCALLLLNYFGGFQDEKISFRVQEGAAWFCTRQLPIKSVIFIR